MAADTATPAAAGDAPHAGEAQALPRTSPTEQAVTDLLYSYGHGLSWKEKVAYIGVCLTQCAQAETPVEHVIGHGMYIRKMKIPARTVFIGRPHTVGHEVSLLKGAVIVINETGKVQYHAPKTIHTVPGYQMVVYTLTDIECQTVHPNPTYSHDLDALEAAAFESADDMRALGESVARRLLQ
jgi:hypothetical protein